jgi:hypothetical protein
MAVRAAEVCGIVSGSVQQCSSMPGSVRQCERQFRGSARDSSARAALPVAVCGSAAVCAAVCGSSQQCAAVCGSARGSVCLFVFINCICV